MSRRRKKKQGKRRGRWREAQKRKKTAAGSTPAEQAAGEHIGERDVIGEHRAGGETGK